jgi:hypothetical protein
MKTEAQAGFSGAINFSGYLTDVENVTKGRDKFLPKIYGSKSRRKN